MSASPCNNRRDFRRVELPAFISPPQPLPPVTPRCRKHRRPTISLGECALVAVLSLSLGIAAGAVTRLPVPASVVEAGN